MDQVSEHCGISKRTLYEQFSDKGRLLRLCLDQINQTQIKARQELYQTSNNIIDYLLLSTRQTIDVSQQYHPNFFPELKRYYPALAQYQEEISESVLNQELMSIIEKGIEEGLFRAETKLKVVVQLLRVQLEAIYFSDLLSKNNFSLPEVFNTLIFNFMRGIATPKGLLVLETYETD